MDNRTLHLLISTPNSFMGEILRVEYDEHSTQKIVYGETFEDTLQLEALNEVLEAVLKQVKTDLQKRKENE